ILPEIAGKIAGHQECLVDMEEALSKIIAKTAAKLDSLPFNPDGQVNEVLDFNHISRKALGVAIDCLGVVVPEVELLEVVFKVGDLLIEGLEVIDVCQEPFTKEDDVLSKVSAVIAVDPNDKAGSKGIGEPRYLSGVEPLRY